MAEASAPEPIEPNIITDERAKDGFVRVSVIIPNLQVQSKLNFKQFKKDKEAKNASIDVQFGHSSPSKGFKITVRGNDKGSLAGKVYELNVRQLPHPISTENSYIELKEGRILVFLAKENPSQSWMPELEEGLDMFEEEEES